MPKHQLFADEQQMKLLRDTALFSESQHVKYKAVRALAAFGQDAIPIVIEVADSADNSFKRFCIETIERIECSRALR